MHFDLATDRASLLRILLCSVGGLILVQLLLVAVFVRCGAFRADIDSFVIIEGQLGLDAVRLTYVLPAERSITLLNAYLRLCLTSELRLDTGG